MRKASLIPKAIIAGVFTLVVLVGTALYPSAANASPYKTVNLSDPDNVISLQHSEMLKSTLSSIEADTGVKFAVEIRSKVDDSFNEAAQAEKLAAQSPETIGIVINDTSKSIQLFRGDKAVKYIPQNAFTEVIDSKIIPKLQEGNYVEALASGGRAFGAIYESNNPEVVASNEFKLILKKYGIPILAGVAVLLIFLGVYIFKNSRKAALATKAELDDLNAQYGELEEKAVKFWGEAKPSLKEAYEEAANSDARIEVLESKSSDYFQTFAPSPASLSQMLMTFVYKDTRDPKRSIRSILEQNDKLKQREADTIQKWESLTDTERDSFKNAASEAYQEVLAGKMFPEEDPEVMVSRFRTFVPESRPEDEFADLLAYEDLSGSRVAEVNSETGEVTLNESDNESADEATASDLTDDIGTEDLTPEDK